MRTGRREQKGASGRAALCALLLALMLILGYLETLLPSPGIPGIKLGLSNSVLLFAVFMLDTPAAYVLMTMKVALSGMLFSGFQAAVYAFAGGLVSVTGMALAVFLCGRKEGKAKPVFVSMLGGALHNLGQIAAAMLVLHTFLPRYLVILLLSGLACGALTGFIAQRVMTRLKNAGFGIPGEKTEKS